MVVVRLYIGICYVGGLVGVFFVLGCSFVRRWFYGELWRFSCGLRVNIYIIFFL